MRKAPLTSGRKKTYLKALAATGSHEAAATAASPHLQGDRAGGSTFRELRKKDPEFALQCEEAIDEFLGKMERTIAHWATEPTKRYQLDKNGNRVLVEEKPPNERLMLAALRRLAPERWNEKKQLEVSGQVDHKHSGNVFTISYEHAVLLSPDKRALLADLIEEATQLGEQQGTLIEHEANVEQS